MYALTELLSVQTERIKTKRQLVLKFFCHGKHLFVIFNLIGVISIKATICLFPMFSFLVLFASFVFRLLVGARTGARASVLRKRCTLFIQSVGLDALDQVEEILIWNSGCWPSGQLTALVLYSGSLQVQ